MKSFVIRRIISGIVLLYIVCTATFVLLSVGANQVAHSILGAEATTETVDAWNKAHHLDAPLLTRYVEWISHAIRGDFGQPWVFSQGVSEMISQRLSVTIVIVIIAITLAAIFSLILGVTAAIRGGWIDRFVQVLGLAGFAIPSFLLALILILFFSVKIHIFNAVGYTAPTTNFGEFVKSATLPISALVFSSLASLTQQVRGAVKDVLENDYIRTLRTRGLSNRRVIFKHALRNAVTPALSVLGLQFAGLLGGTVILEQIFAIPGMGAMSVTATAQKDLPAVMGIVCVTAVIVIVVNTVIDLISAALNPKVRLS